MAAPCSESPCSGAPTNEFHTLFLHCSKQDSKGSDPDGLGTACQTSSNTAPAGGSASWTTPAPWYPLRPACRAFRLLPPRARIVIETPLRLKRANRLVTPEHFGFADLFGNLLRRISMLTYFHTDTPLETDFRGLVDRAREVATVQADLQWHDATRYSSRQDATMQMGGVLGVLDIAADDLEPYWPYLWLGQWTHAGRFTTMGLGRYRIEDAASLPDPLPA